MAQAVDVMYHRCRDQATRFVKSGVVMRGMQEGSAPERMHRAPPDRPRGRGGRGHGDRLLVLHLLPCLAASSAVIVTADV